MKWRMLFTLFIVTCLGLAAFEVGLLSEESPRLKPELALEIRTLQLQRSELTVQMQLLAGQYLDLQRKSAALDAEVQEKLKAAARASAIDLDKFEIDPATLTAKPKPAPKKPN